jgi:hypothetical protein
VSIIKNYVVCAHRRIKSTKWVWKDTKDEGDIYEIYRQMCLHSLASARHFLEGDWEYILWDQEIEHINDAMPLNNQLTYDLWHKEPCNILWVGPDVQFVKPTKIFGEFDNFRLFNWTDPKSWYEANQYNAKFDNLFNNDLNYHPHTMDPKLWEIERQMHNEWNKTDGMDSYNNQQIIHNTMFWSQNLDWADAHRPELFYQAQWLPSWTTVETQDQWNGCKYEDAQVIHWHSSRHAPTKLECMRQVNEALGVPPVTELK